MDIINIVAPTFLAADDEAKLWDIFHYWLRGDLKSGQRINKTSNPDILTSADFHDRSMMCLLALLMKMMRHVKRPMAWTGDKLEYILNFSSHNGGIIGFLFRLITFDVVFPHRLSETYISFLGHIDGRLDLYKYNNTPLNKDGSISWNRTLREPCNRTLMDLCVMASSIAYENENVVRKVVNEHWKMHFVCYHDCWNENQNCYGTHVFIICDKKVDPDFILVSFRGTGPFDADNWSTDVDYTWHDVPNMGRIHTGFLEAMGLGDRDKPEALTSNLKNPEGMQSSSTLARGRVHKSAYIAVRNTLRTLLERHKNAKVVVTGHSLGGALAIVFPIVLEYNKEEEIMERLSCIYTFGQPRVGDESVENYMEKRLMYPTRRYFRTVYCHDIVPRVPYDDKVFCFKHFGTCVYYDTWFYAHDCHEEPDKNSYGLWYLFLSQITAVWELVRGMFMGIAYGPLFREGWLMMLFRVFGILQPGLSAHCLTNYINSVRVGKKYKTS